VCGSLPWLLRYVSGSSAHSVRGVGLVGVLPPGNLGVGLSGIVALQEARLWTGCLVDKDGAAVPVCFCESPIGRVGEGRSSAMLGSGIRT